jgi:hypothetical protein
MRPQLPARWTSSKVATHKRPSEVKSGKAPTPWPHYYVDVGFREEEEKGKESRVKTFLRSVSVLDKWLKDNDGKLEDEVRVQRVKHWREEAIEQLRRKLNLSRR